MISGGLDPQWLEAGFRFPGQRLKSGRGNESTESRPLDHQGLVASDKPWPSALQKMNFYKEAESSETSKLFIGRKRVCVGRHMGELRERESCPRGSLNHLYGAFLPGFLWPITLLCLALSLYLVYLRVLPCVRVHVLAKMDSSKEAYG